MIKETPVPTSGTPDGRGIRMAPVLLHIAAMIGIGALLYPSAANWFAMRGHNAEISGYVEITEQLSDSQAMELLTAAQIYNGQLPDGVLQDPFSQVTPHVSDDPAYQAYTDMLTVSDSDAIGHLNYPARGISMPIYHGTDDEVLKHGVGHLYGSSLPVGGPSTRSVLTSHSGLVNASLFTPLLDAEVRETFSITVLGEERFYEVREIDTVLPNDTGSLRLLEGQEWVTLITCAPLGINSHRLLVHAEHIPAPDVEGTALAGDGLSAGFPWWALIFIAASAAVGNVLWRPRKNSVTRRKQSVTRQQEKTL